MFTLKHVLNLHVRGVVLEQVPLEKDAGSCMQRDIKIRVELARGHEILHSELYEIQNLLFKQSSKDKIVLSLFLVVAERINLDLLRHLKVGIILHSFAYDTCTYFIANIKTQHVFFNTYPNKNILAFCLAQYFSNKLLSSKG